jgi:hypothetical protein
MPITPLTIRRQYVKAGMALAERERKLTMFYANLGKWTTGSVVTAVSATIRRLRWPDGFVCRRCGAINAQYAQLRIA